MHVWEWNEYPTTHTLCPGYQEVNLMRKYHPKDSVTPTNLWLVKAYQQKEKYERESKGKATLKNLIKCLLLLRSWNFTNYFLSFSVLLGILNRQTFLITIPKVNKISLSFFGHTFFFNHAPPFRHYYPCFFLSLLVHLFNFMVYYQVTQNVIKI